MDKSLKWLKDKKQMKKVSSTPAGMMKKHGKKLAPILGELHEKSNLPQWTKPGSYEEALVQEK